MTFNVIPDVLFVSIDDTAPKVAVSDDTVSMFDLHLTNNDVVSDITLTGLVFNVESSENGVIFEAEASTLIDYIEVEDLTNGGTIYQGAPSGTNSAVNVVLTGIPDLPAAGGTFDFNVRVKLRNDISAARVPNIVLRISDVGGYFPGPPPVIIVPVDENLNPISLPEWYIRSGVTNIRQSGEDAAFNYPNPFNPRRQVTNIVYYSPSNGQAAIKIFTIAGKLVRSLKQNAAAGSNEVQWDGKNGRGQIVRNGVYVAIIMAPGGSKQTVKIAVVK